MLLAAFAVSVGHPSLALADETPAPGSSVVTLSERRAADAFQAYTRKDYAAAVALYLDAYEAEPRGEILYNIARIYDTKLGDPPLAITFYRRYIANPGLYTERIELANQRLTELRQAEVMASKPAEPRPLPAVTPAVMVRNRAEPAPIPAHVSDSGGSSQKTWAVVVGSVGAASLIAGGALALLAHDKSQQSRDQCNPSDRNLCSPAGVTLRDEAQRLALFATSFAIAGGSLLAAGTVVYVTAPRDERGAFTGLSVGLGSRF